MKLEQAHINEIKRRFSVMASKEDFVELLNYVKPIIYGKKTIPFELKQITYYANPKVSGKRYKDFTVNKKSGGVRTIHAPLKGLKAIQRCLNIILQCAFEPHKAATGFIAGKSIVDNAKAHVGNFYVYNIDLKDFFPSVDQARVWKCLQLAPFNLHNEGVIDDRKIAATKKIKSNKKTNTAFESIKRSQATLIELLHEAKSEVNEEILAYQPKKDRLAIANIVSALCCTEMTVERMVDGKIQAVKKNVLPQGAPTSPIITNIVCQRLDHLLSGVAKRFGCKYTRYADDITFSSLHNIYQKDSEFIVELNRIVTEQGFIIKSAKTRLQKAGYRQEVTGLVVNEKVNVKRRYVKEIRKWLYLWERYGYEKANFLFVNDYTKDRGYIKGANPNLLRVLDGKLNYLQMVVGKVRTSYVLLANRFTNLIKENKEYLDQIDSSLVKDITTVKRESQNTSVVVNKLTKELAIKEKAISRIIMGNNLIDENSENSVHNPKHVVKLLNRFTVETDLKNTTHFWDRSDSGGYPYKSYEDFIGKYMKDINSPDLSFKDLPRYNKDFYWNLIHPFLIQDTVYKSYKGESIPFKWGRYNLTVGYQYPSLLKNWMAENPGRTPFEMPIPKRHIPRDPVDGKTLSYFEDFVEVFKKGIEYRRNDFYYSIRRLTDNLGIDFRPDIIDLKGLNFYTDTYQVEQALERIFNQIKENPQYPDIRISGKYDDLTREVRIEILQVNSYCDKPIDDDKINLKSRKGDFWIIRTKLHSLCNWSIESRFRINNQFAHYRFNYLSETVDISPVELPYDSQGFKHILTFFV